MVINKTKVQEWKKKYGENAVFQLTVGDKSCILRKPDRKILSFAGTAMGDSKDSMKFNEALLNACWLDGDKEVKTDDDYFLSASNQLANLINIKEAELKKL